MNEAVSLENRQQQIRRRIKELNATTTTSVQEFEKNLKEAIELEIEGNALLTVRRIMMDVFTKIVMRTPVDTGRARASWQFSEGQDNAQVIPEGDYKDKIPGLIEEALSKIAVAPATVWYISNHLDYIEPLEAGWSNQAPAGMVSLTLQEMSRQLERGLAS